MGLQASNEDIIALADPIIHDATQSPLLLFAGEHTHLTSYSTTVGAYFSGEREAQRLLTHWQAQSKYRVGIVSFVGLTPPLTLENFSEFTLLKESLAKLGVSLTALSRFSLSLISLSFHIRSHKLSRYVGTTLQWTGLAMTFLSFDRRGIIFTICPSSLHGVITPPLCRISVTRLTSWNGTLTSTICWTWRMLAFRSLAHAS